MSDLTQSATVQTPIVTPTGATPPAALQTPYDYINAMLSQRLATVIVKKQKMQYSILHIGEFNQDWLMCEVENVGNIAGDDLLIVVAKTTPITVYINGAVPNPPAFTAQ
jgi:hypothetical protein